MCGQERQNHKDCRHCSIPHRCHWCGKRVMYWRAYGGEEILRMHK